MGMKRLVSLSSIHNAHVRHLMCTSHANVAHTHTTFMTALNPDSCHPALNPDSCIEPFERRPVMKTQQRKDTYLRCGASGEVWLQKQPATSEPAHRRS